MRRGHKPSSTASTRADAERLVTEALDWPVVMGLIGSVALGAPLGAGLVRAIRNIRALLQAGKATAAEKAWDKLSQSDRRAIDALLRQQQARLREDEEFDPLLEEADIAHEILTELWEADPSTLDPFIDEFEVLIAEGSVEMALDLFDQIEPLVTEGEWQRLDEYKRMTMQARMQRARSRRTGLTKEVRSGRKSRAEVKRENRQARREYRRSPGEKIKARRYRRRTRHHRARVRPLPISSTRSRQTGADRRVGPRRNESMNESANTLNVATTPLEAARRYAETQFKRNGKSLDEVIPDFDSNYLALQKKLRRALNIPRIEMPVIEPSDMGKFLQRLKSGSVDIFKPYMKGSKLFAPKSFPHQGVTGAEYVELGFQDGSADDDKIPARMGSKPANQLIPTQSQIWLEKLVENIARFGVPSSSSPIAKATIIVSKEGYILDGHHRFGQAMLANPTLKLSALLVPIDIKTLLKIGRSYGEAIGNRVKEHIERPMSIADKLIEYAWAEGNRANQLALGLLEHTEPADEALVDMGDGRHYADGGDIWALHGRTLVEGTEWVGEQPPADLFERAAQEIADWLDEHSPEGHAVPRLRTYLTLGGVGLADDLAHLREVVEALDLLAEVATATRPSLGTSVYEVMRGWRNAKPPSGSHVVVGMLIPGPEYQISARGQIMRTATAKNVPIEKPATQKEISDIEDAIDQGMFQVEIRPLRTGGKRWVLHQATGRPLQPLSEAAALLDEAVPKWRGADKVYARAGRLLELMGASGGATPPTKRRGKIVASGSVSSEMADLISALNAGDEEEVKGQMAQLSVRFPRLWKQALKETADFGGEYRLEEETYAQAKPYLKGQHIPVDQGDVVAIGYHQGRYYARLRSGLTTSIAVTPAMRKKPDMGRADAREKFRYKLRNELGVRNPDPLIKKLDSAPATFRPTSEAIDEAASRAKSAPRITGGPPSPVPIMLTYVAANGSFRYWTGEKWIRDGRQAKEFDTRKEAERELARIPKPKMAEDVDEARVSRQEHARRMEKALGGQGTRTSRPIDRNEYPQRRGLEGPFRFRDGRILYYDPREGKYYDSKADIYVEPPMESEEIVGYVVTEAKGRDHGFEVGDTIEFTSPSGRKSGGKITGFITVGGGTYAKYKSAKGSGEIRLDGNPKGVRKVNEDQLYEAYAPKKVNLSMSDQVGLNSEMPGEITPAVHAWAQRKFAKGNAVTVTKYEAAKRDGKIEVHTKRASYTITKRGSYIIVKKEDTTGKRSAEFYALSESIDEASAAEAFASIKAGVRVTIRTPQGQERSGKAVMRGPYGWVLNLGGKHGTPGIASPENIVKVGSMRVTESDDDDFDPDGPDGGMLFEDDLDEAKFYPLESFKVVRIGVDGDKRELDLLEREIRRNHMRTEFNPLRGVLGTDRPSDRVFYVHAIDKRFSMRNAMERAGVRIEETTVTEEPYLEEADSAQQKAYKALFLKELKKAGYEDLADMPEDEIDDFMDRMKGLWASHPANKPNKKDESDDETDDLSAQGEAKAKALAKQMGAIKVTSKGPSVNATFDDQDKAEKFLGRAKKIGKAVMRRSGDEEYTVHIDEALDEGFRAPHYTVSNLRSVQQEVEMAAGSVLYLHELDNFRRGVVDMIAATAKKMDDPPVIMFGLGDDPSGMSDDGKKRHKQRVADAIKALRPYLRGTKPMDIGAARQLAKKMEAKNESVVEIRPESLDESTMPVPPPQNPEGGFFDAINRSCGCASTLRAEICRLYWIAAHRELGRLASEETVAQYLDSPRGNDLGRAVVAEMDSGATGHRASRDPKRALSQVREAIRTLGASVVDDLAAIDAADAMDESLDEAGAPGRHQQRIARDTLKMSASGAIDGDMDHKEAVAVLMKAGWNRSRLENAMKAAGHEPDAIKDFLSEAVDERAPMGEPESITAPPKDSPEARSAQAVADQIKRAIKLPVVNTAISTLGNAAKPTIFVTLGFEPQETWINRIFENSVYTKIALQHDGTIETTVRPWKRGMKLPFLRKGKWKDASDAVRKISAFVKKVQGALSEGVDEAIGDLMLDFEIDEMLSGSVPSGVGGIQPFPVLVSPEELDDDEEPLDGQLDEAIRTGEQLATAIQNGDVENDIPAWMGKPGDLGYLRGKKIERNPQFRGRKVERTRGRGRAQTGTLTGRMVWTYAGVGNAYEIRLDGGGTMWSADIRPIGWKVQNGKVVEVSEAFGDNAFSDALTEAWSACARIGVCLDEPDEATAAKAIQTARKQLFPQMAQAVKKVRAAVDQAEKGSKGIRDIGGGDRGSREILGGIGKALQEFAMMLERAIKFVKAKGGIIESLDERGDAHDSILALFIATQRSWKASQVAAQLGISVADAMRQLTRLVREGSLDFKRGDGYHLKTPTSKGSIQIPADLDSSAMRRALKQHLSGGNRSRRAYDSGLIEDEVVRLDEDETKNPDAYELCQDAIEALREELNLDGQMYESYGHGGFDAACSMDTTTPKGQRVSLTVAHHDAEDSLHTILHGVRDSYTSPFAHTITVAEDAVPNATMVLDALEARDFEAELHGLVESDDEGPDDDPDGIVEAFELDDLDEDTTELVGFDLDEEITVGPDDNLWDVYFDATDDVEPGSPEEERISQEVERAYVEQVAKQLKLGPVGRAKLAGDQVRVSVGDFDLYTDSDASDSYVYLDKGTGYRAAVGFSGNDKNRTPAQVARMLLADWRKNAPAEESLDEARTVEQLVPGLTFVSMPYGPSNLKGQEVKIVIGDEPDTGRILYSTLASLRGVKLGRPLTQTAVTAAKKKAKKAVSGIDWTRGEEALRSDPKVRAAYEKLKSIFHEALASAKADFGESVDEYDCGPRPKNKGREGGIRDDGPDTAKGPKARFTSEEWEAIGQMVESGLTEEQAIDALGLVEDTLDERMQHISKDALKEMPRIEIGRRTFYISRVKRWGTGKQPYTELSAYGPRGAWKLIQVYDSGMTRIVPMSGSGNDEWVSNDEVKNLKAVVSGARLLKEAVDLSEDTLDEAKGMGFKPNTTITKTDSHEGERTVKAMKLDRATLFMSGEMMGNFRKVEARDVTVYFDKWAQYPAALYVEFTPKGKRNPRRYVKGYKPQVVIYQGWGHDLDPEDLFAAPETDANTGVTVRHGKRTAFSGGWADEMKARVKAYSKKPAFQIWEGQADEAIEEAAELDGSVELLYVDGKFVVVIPDGGTEYHFDDYAEAIEVGEREAASNHWQFVDNSHLGGGADAPEYDTAPEAPSLGEGDIYRDLYDDELDEDLDESLAEGIHDPHILKAIFFAGGAGSGKTFIAETAFKGLGLKFLSSDAHLERAMKRAGLSTKTDMGSDAVQRPGGLRAQAKAKESGQMDLWLRGRLGLVLETTGQNLSNVRKRMNLLRKAGYDCYAIFVNTSLEVAQARNQERARSLPTTVVDQIWKDAQKHKAELKKLVGSKNFEEVVNDEVLSPREVRAELVPRLHRLALRLLQRPVSNPIGQAWMAEQRAPRDLAASWQDDSPVLAEDLDESLVASIAAVLTDKPRTVEQIAKALGIPATGVSKQGYSMRDLKDQLGGMTRSHLHPKGKRAKMTGGGYVAEGIDETGSDSSTLAAEIANFLTHKPRPTARDLQDAYRLTASAAQQIVAMYRPEMSWDDLTSGIARKMTPAMFEDEDAMAEVVESARERAKAMAKKLAAAVKRGAKSAKAATKEMYDVVGQMGADMIGGMLGESDDVDEANADGLPPEPRKWTRAQTQKAIDKLSKWTTAKLRKHQSIGQQQIPKAHKAGNTDALADLQAMQDVYTAAIMRREFGEDLDEAWEPDAVKVGDKWAPVRRKGSKVEYMLSAAKAQSTGKKTGKGRWDPKAKVTWTPDEDVAVTKANKQAAMVAADRVVEFVDETGTYAKSEDLDEARGIDPLENTPQEALAFIKRSKAPVTVKQTTKTIRGSVRPTLVVTLKGKEVSQEDFDRFSDLRSDMEGELDKSNRAPQVMVDGRPEWAKFRVTFLPGSDEGIDEMDVPPMGNMKSGAKALGDKLKALYDAEYSLTNGKARTASFTIRQALFTKTARLRSELKNAGVDDAIKILVKAAQQGKNWKQAKAALGPTYAVESEDLDETGTAVGTEGLAVEVVRHLLNDPRATAKDLQDKFRLTPASARKIAAMDATQERDPLYRGVMAAIQTVAEDLDEAVSPEDKQRLTGKVVVKAGASRLKKVGTGARTHTVEYIDPEGAPGGSVVTLTGLTKAKAASRAKAIASEHGLKVVNEDDESDDATEIVEFEESAEVLALLRQGKDVTQSRLSEVTSRRNLGSSQTQAYTKKRAGAKLTATEQRVIQHFSEPTDIGLISNALLHAKSLPRSNNERAAMLSLLDRGVLRVISISEPSVGSGNDRREFIVQARQIGVTESDETTEIVEFEESQLPTFTLAAQAAGIDESTEFEYRDGKFSATVPAEAASRIRELVALT